MSEKLTRGEFLKAGLAAGLGVTALGALAGCSASASGGNASGGSSAEGSWDKEVNVLVVGSGTVAYAALAAKANGAEKVTIIDKGTMWGGTSATSGQTLWIPLSYAGQEAGMADTREDALTYMKLCAAGRGNEKAMEVFVDNANALLEWTRDEFGWEWTTDTLGMGFKDYYEPYKGYRAHGRQTVLSGDSELWDVLQKTVTDIGVEVIMGTPVTSLVTDDAGAVVGVVAKEGSTEIRIKADTVILGTGGYDHNSAMMRSFQGMPLFATVAVHENTGDAQLMGQAIGAQLGNMDTNWGLPFFFDESFDPQADIVYKMEWRDWGIYRSGAGSIVVNKQGRRFANEGSGYPVFNRSFANYNSGTLEYENIPAVWICDSNYALSGLPGKASEGELPSHIFQADTLAEIAQHFGIDAAALEEEVAAFNEHAVQGIDPVFHRGEKEIDKSIVAYHPYAAGEIVNPCLAPVATPPFYASLYVPGTCGTSGGLKTNEFAQVLDTKDEIIPNLYAVGNCSAGITGGQYCGAGLTLSAGAVMSWVAAKTALGIS